jgi:predicted exporter
MTAGMQHISRSAKLAVMAWLAFLLACGLIISRSTFTTDLSAFLPRSPTAEQQLLLDQIRDGVASRIILVNIDGADAKERAQLSKQLASRLRQDPAFVSVQNGEPVNTEQDRAYFFNNRYLLSSAVTPARFEVAGLRDALNESVDLLTSPAGLMVKSILPQDPSGEMMHLLGQLTSAKQPALSEGVWASRDGKRAVMLVQTKASGADTDAQEAAINRISKNFKDLQTAASKASLQMTGPSVFGVKARETIHSEVTWLSILSTVLIAVLLLAVYRSVLALGLGFLPVISGALAGIAAVSLAFGSVHGITLGFGTALIGEAVDYSIYLFVQSRQGTVAHAQRQTQWLKQFWPTIRLGVLTSIVGFAALLWSGFPGLAQLGLYSIAGLITAALVTRFVLPHLLPQQFSIREVSNLGLILSKLVQKANAIKWPTLIVIALATAVVVQNRQHIWNDKISSLSPVSQTDIQLDASLRMDTGAPDTRYIVVTTGDSREDVLQNSERIGQVLQALKDEGLLASYEAPSRYLPSLASQKQRQASLPDVGTLKRNLTAASVGLPFKTDVFAPFYNAIEKAKTQPLLEAKDLVNTSMQTALDALLIQPNQQEQQGARWSALLPLTANANSSIDAQRLNADLQALNTNMNAKAILVDMKLESDHLYAGYLSEAIKLSVGGLLAMVVLLLAVTRSVKRVLRLMVPLLAAVITVTAGLSLFGQQLIILHLIGLLLVVAVGSNYALFFDSPKRDVISPSTLTSMLVANMTTVAGFGLLAFSKVSILQAMGVTVAPGVVLALLYAAIFAPSSSQKQQPI